MRHPVLRTLSQAWLSNITGHWILRFSRQTARCTRGNHAAITPLRKATQGQAPASQGYTAASPSHQGLRRGKLVPSTNCTMAAAVAIVNPEGRACLCGVSGRRGWGLSAPAHGTVCHLAKPSTPGASHFSAVNGESSRLVGTGITRPVTPSGHALP